MPENKKIEKKIDRWITEVDKSLREKKDQKTRRETARILSLAGNIGFSMSVPLVGGAILGSFLDKRFQTGPRLTLFFLFLGFIIGGYTIYTVLKELDNE